MKSRYPNQGFARLIVASFDEKKSISIVRSAWVGFRAGSLVIAREDVERFSPNTKLNVMMFGEDGYAGRGLSNGTLTKRFVAPDSARILTVHVPVKTIEKRKAALAAFDLIDAVGEQMKTVPSKNKYGIPVTVGGPVDVVFLGKETRPERLIWKQEIPAWLTYPPPPPPPSFGRKPEPTHADVKSPLSAKTTLANAELGVSPLSKLLPPSSLSDMAIRFQVVPLKFFGDLLKTASVRRAPTAVTKDVSQDSPVAAARASDGVDVPTPGPEPQSPSTPLAPAANAGDAPLNNDATER
jgi:hypothetical protein